MADGGLGTLVCRVVELRHNMVVFDGARPLFVSLTVDGVVLFTAPRAPDAPILEQFVIALRRPDCVLKVELHERRLLLNRTVGRFVVKLSALPMESTVDDAYVFQGRMAGAELRLVLLRTTLRECDMGQLDDREALLIASDLRQLDSDANDGDDWVVVGRDNLLDKATAAVPASAPAGHVVPGAPASATLRELLLRLQIECSDCRSGLTDDLIALDCEHLFCRACFRRRCVDAVARGDYAALACCAAFPDYALRRVLDADAMDRVIDWRFAKSQSEAGAEPLSHCPKCQLGFVAVVSASQLSLDPLEACRAAYRFRCRGCSVSFCNMCHASPYHDGHTCESYAAWVKCRKCRFCRGMVGADAPEQQRHCSDCAPLWEACCKKTLPCDHPCCGVDGELDCLPCLYCGGAAVMANVANDNNNNNSNVMESTARADDFCPVCYVDDLAAQPCVRLRCSHVMHRLCLVERLRSGFGESRRMAFRFLGCPLCSGPVGDHPALAEAAAPWQALEQTVRAMAVQRLAYENRTNDAKIAARYSGDAAAFAMDVYAYYLCTQCKRPFFAGAAECGEAPVEAPAICQRCDATAEAAPTCAVHGRDFIVFKCRFCCSVASFKCWGTHSFCQSCHEVQVRGFHLSKQPKSHFPVCGGASVCPLHVDHPHVMEFCLGCSLCIAAREF